MKKLLLFLIAVSLIGGLTLSAQSTSAQGMNYQAVARDASGQVIANLPVALKIALVSKNKDQTEYYSETHQVTTDKNGSFKLIIGEGQNASGKLSDVPWSKDQVWLNVAMDAQNGKNYTLVSSAKLLSVPYAFHAATASQLVQDANAIELPQEKNQSIYWTTGGNTNTRPATHFLGTRDNQDLIMKTNNTTRVILTKEGQMQIKSGVGTGNASMGSDEFKANYPLTIEGSHQGIWIKVNGQRSMKNNFVTFEDNDDVWGEIEGQTLDELKASSEYQNQIALFTLNAVSLAAGAVAFIIEAGGLAATGFGAGAAVGAAANAAALIAESIALAIEIDNWIENTVNSVGVSYSSGAGDYAEWLEREKGIRDMHYGEIVGVRGGKISLNTAEVDHYMVVSTRPIVLGKTPAKGEEHRFEKVAFMGQVPVKVAGPVAIGDYIIPSGNNDGLGVAISPTNMKIGDYAKIVGVSWQAAKDAPLNYVNVAVGINSNDLSSKVDELNQKVEQIMAYLEGKAPLTPDGQVLAQVPTIKPQTTFNKQFTDAEFDQMLDNNATLFKDAFAQAKIKLTNQGYDLSAKPQLSEFFDNPLETMKMVRRDPNYLTQWALIDQKIKSKK